MQRPDQNDANIGSEHNFDVSYGWLIQFKDGNRLDLHVEPIGRENILNDKLCKILLDKDHILPEIPEATDEEYYVRKPSEGQFLFSCNNFWWCLNNVAKGMWREEIPYVQDMYHYCVQSELIKMLNWKIGYETDFQISTGKSSKYMYKWLPKDIWERYLQTYMSGNIKEMWKSIFILCDLFNEVARMVAKYFNFTYDEQEAEGSLSFLKHVHKLPKDAKEIY